MPGADNAVIEKIYNAKGHTRKGTRKKRKEEKKGIVY